MPFAESTNSQEQPYKYNGKELDETLGLNVYDYLAKQLEVGVPKFTSVDPLAEKFCSWSPYVYCYNNPMRFTDPTGMETDSTRVYIETVDYGHAWMSTGEGENMTVYTYALNKKANIGIAGKGVLSKFTGAAAQKYLDQKSKSNYSTYVITDAVDEAVVNFADELLHSSSDIVRKEDGTSNSNNYTIDERNIDIYTPTNNCTTFVSKVLNGSGSLVFPITTTTTPGGISGGGSITYPTGSREIFRLPSSMGKYFENQIKKGDNNIIKQNKK